MQEAAYSLIQEALRAQVHLRTALACSRGRHPPRNGRRQSSRSSIIFDRGAALITQQEERDQLAELNLIAGKRAKSSTAYASALAYLNAGATLLAEDSWERRRELTFALELNGGM